MARGREQKKRKDKKQKEQSIPTCDDSDANEPSSFSEKEETSKIKLFAENINEEEEKAVDDIEDLDSCSNLSDSNDFISDDDNDNENIDEIDHDDIEKEKVDLESMMINILDGENVNIPDINTVRDYIGKLVEILSVKKSKESPISHSRSKIIQCLTGYLAFYYGYSEYMIEKLGSLFTIKEFIEFLEANQVPRPVTIRVNTLKTKKRNLIQALKNRGMVVECIDKIADVCLQVFESDVPVGATPEYLAGHYMLQSAASILPVLALGPKPNERILDMCAAPGGKTTHISSMMKNTGLVLAIDVNQERIKALIANLHRLGAANTIVACQDSRKIPEKIKGFNRILLDAPCSGTGVISKDASVKVSKSDEDFSYLSHLQKELLVAAVESTIGNSNPDDGIIVYSTCSVTIEENEQVIDYILKKYPNLRLIDTGIELGNSGFTNFKGKSFHPSLKLTKRFYPHVNNVDGFFVAKLKKYPEIKKQEKSKEENRKQQSLKINK